MSVTNNVTVMRNKCDLLLKSYLEARDKTANRYCDLIFDVCEQYADGIPMGQIDETIKEYVLKIKENM